MSRWLLTDWKLLMMMVRKMLTKMHVMDIVNVKNIRGPSTAFALCISMKLNLPAIRFGNSLIALKIAINC